MTRRLVFLPLLLAAGCNCGGRVGGVNANLSVDPPNLDFGTAAPGAVVSRALTLTNTGRSELRVTTMQVLGGTRGGAFVVVNPVAVMSAGSTAQVELRFTADAVAGADAATLLIESNADDQPRVSVALVGRTAAACTAGCDGGNTTNQDAGQDAGLRDAGSPDAGAPDAGLRADGGFCGNADVARSVVTPTGDATGTSQVVWSGSEFAIAWEEVRSDGGIEVQFARVSALGQPVAGSARTVSPDDGHRSMLPRLAFSGSGFGLTYLDDRNGSTQRLGVFRRLDLQGNPVGQELLVGPAFSGSTLTVAWQPVSGEWGVASNQLVGGVAFTRIAANGTPTQVGMVAPGALLGVGTELAPDGSGWALVTTVSGVTLTRLAGDGAVLSSRAIGGGGIRPSVAPTGSGYAVSWGSDPQASFALADAQGQLVPGSFLQLSANQATSEPTVAWTGQDFVVAWIEFAGAPSRAHVWKRRVSPSGVPTGPAVRVTCDTEGSYNYWPGAVAGPGVVAVSYSAGVSVQPYVAPLGLLLLY